VPKNKRYTHFSSIRTKHTMEKAKYPLFECAIPYIGTLAAVSIGCDVLVGGLEGLGAKKVWDAYITLKKDNEEGLLARFKQFL